MNETPRTTAHSNCDHPATKAARTACRKARAAAPAYLAATILDEDRPAMNMGPTLYCLLCADEIADHTDRRFRKVSDMRQIPCPCGRRYDDGVAYGARYIESN